MKYLILAVAIVSFLFSCKKSTETASTSVNWQNAQILDFNDLSVGGCGWMVQVANAENTVFTIYRPNTLPDSFRVANKQVSVNIQALTSYYYCPVSTDSFLRANLLDIKSR